MSREIPQPEGPIEVALDVLEDKAEPSDAELEEEPDPQPADRPTARPRARSAGASSAHVSSSDALGAYLAEITRVPMLDAAEEVDLASQVQDGLAARALLHTVAEPGQDLPREEQDRLRQAMVDGRLAAERMTEANLRLVVSVARRYAGVGVPLLDLIQDGNLGLMRAVEKFDPTRGFKFSTYATWWIRQACSRGLVLRRHLRLPDDLHWQLQRLRRAERELAGLSGTDPSDAALAAHLDLPVAKVVQLRGLPADPVSLHQPLGGEGDATLGDVLTDDQAVPLADQVVAAQLPPALRRVLATLPDRQRRVLELRFGLGDNQPHTLEEIAREFGVTRERVRQLETGALAKLRHHPEARELHQP